ncbi:MAG: hypothetical protein H7Z11_18140 [Verrucomicrobia bacterium]|nr:hypothetical protein [Leptolyngbya sp. ES-bin-22]
MLTSRSHRRLDRERSEGFDVSAQPNGRGVAGEKTQNSKLSSLSAQSATQNSKLKTQNSKLKTQNSKLHPFPFI